jgi:hypothetical protein
LAWEAQSSTGRANSAGLFGGLTGKQRRLIHKPIESNQDGSPVLFRLGVA